MSKTSPALQTSTLRPGLLVSLKTSISGNVQYRSRDIESERLTEDGAQRAVWETERTITDPAEHEAARKAQAKASSLIRALCAKSAFGLLCPESGADDLARAIAAAREVADEFNAQAALSRVYIHVITGRIAADDVEAVRAINSEVRELLELMESGVRNLDAKAVRDAATRAKSLGAMLSREAQANVQIAIDAARATATKIVKAGDTAAQEIDTRTLATLREQRTAFLDMDIEPVKVAAPKARGRAVDFEPAEASAARKRAFPARRQVEVE